MTQQAEDGAGVGADAVELALQLCAFAGGNELSQTVVGVVDVAVTLLLAQGVLPLLPGQVHLRDHCHVSGQAALVGQLDAGVGQFFLRVHRGQVHQVEGQLQARLVPAAVDEVAVGVVVEAVVEADVGEQPDQGLAGLQASDTV